MKAISRVIRNSLFLHGVFWMLAYYVLLNIFSGSSSFQRVDFIYTANFLASLMMPVLLNLYLLIPGLLRKGHYFSYVLGFIGLGFLFALLNQIIFNHLIDFVLPGYYFISFYTFGDLLKFFFAFLVITTLLQLSKEWFELNTTRQRMLRLEKEKVDAELKALANQVNPHFLFNSLNVIYSLAVNQRKESPEAILKLSDILRYVIYDSSGDHVSLDAEVRLIRNYIDLQRFRVGREANISFATEGTSTEMVLAPMLLLPLVENGFKHGIKGDIGKTFLKILLRIEENDIIFTITNNKGTASGEDIGSGSGVGLENIRNRLQLIYPDAHELDIEETEDRFLVKLTLRNLTKKVQV
jgi:sensor histidine kinase YesM